MSRVVSHLIPPPRPVPLLVRCQVLFGGVLNQIGWFFFGFGLCFFWIFGLNSELATYFWFRLPLRTAAGVVSDVRETSASENEARIYAYHFSFTAEDGKPYTGVSYVTGSSEAKKRGDEVAIAYPAGHPSKARMEGMRRAMFGSWAAVVSIFPAVGLGLLIPGFRLGIKANRLLARGLVTVGALKSRKPTNMRVNQRTVYRLTFGFVTADGRDSQVVVKTAAPEVLQDEAQEPLLYDPWNPSYAVMMDSLPGSSAIDPSGNLQSAGTLKAVLPLVVPAITLLGHGAYVYFGLLQ